MQQHFNYARLLRYPFSNYKNYGQLTQVKLDKSLLENIENKQYHFIQYYRQNGHLVAQLDPLQLIENKQKEMPGVLDFGIKYDDNIKVNNILKKDVKSIEELEEYINKLYAQSVGVEFEQVEDPEEKQWLHENYEKFMNEEITQADRVSIHNLLVQMEAIDHYYHKKFTTFKRYAGEGGEGVIIALRAIYGQAVESGVTDVVQSMAHRGRFPIMSSLLDYPPSDIFRKIMGESDLPSEYTFGVDDVVHHLSTSNKKKFNNKDLTITVVHNPSHLEAANPVSQGKAKAKQDDYSNVNQVLNLQLHGDAAFAGQGIVYESMLLSGLDNYSNGGTVHIIQNNQIGYTTNIKDSRFFRYSSDLLLAYKYPILHVNGEDVETLNKVSKFAVEYRQKFKKDILIDIVTYRKYGHNEVDEPSFTQPNMYERVRKVKSLPLKYNQLYFRQEDYEKIRQKVFTYLDSEYEKAKNMKQTLAKITDEKSKGSKAFTQKWNKMKFSQFCEQDAKTGLNKDYLINLAKQSVVIKPNFNLHPRLQKYFIDDRLDQIQKNSIDWATCESVAVGSLLEEGFNVRLSGEDVERGTFSQRHWAFIDQKTEEKWIPMQNFADAKMQGRLQVVNSPLAEASVMGYEFGYSLENPNNLVMWEAQFGDFYNTGQHMSDTFITCAEEKWMRQSSLVLLLPHGYDGAGPEHSSCRMERWLQQGVQNQNFQFAIPSNPSSIFHILRRQMHRQFRKPLVIANAKSLLRSNKAQCKFEDLSEDKSFQRIITHQKGDHPNKVIFTYGKFVYDLLDQLEKKNADNYIIFTFEQLLPFPKYELELGLKQINKDVKFYFVQEEPQNQGGFNYCQLYIDQILTSLQFTKKTINYIGRPECPCVAVGATVLHKQELQNIVIEFFILKKIFDQIQIQQIQQIQIKLNVSINKLIVYYEKLLKIFIFMQTELDVEKPSYQSFIEETQKSNCFFYQDDPITLYNQFIRLYNQDINQVNGIKLEEMKTSKVVQFIHNYLRNIIGSIILLIILFIPILNIAFYLLLQLAFLKLTQNYLIFKNNINLVLDPFGNMVENQDICVMMKKNYLIFKLDIKETEGLHFSKSVKEMIKNRSSGSIGNNKIEFTIYNQNLKQDYYGFPNYRCNYLVWSLSSCLLIVSQLVFLIILIKMSDNE